MSIDRALTGGIQTSGCRFLAVLTAYIAVATIFSFVASAAETLDLQGPKRTDLKKLEIKTHLTARKRTLEKIKKRKNILDYEVILAGERFYRDTYLDTADLHLYRHQMFYRVREDYDGQVWIEFQDRGSVKDSVLIQPIYFAPVPLDQVSLAKQGGLTDNGSARRLKEA
ncbi:MAG: hypothetical protein V3T60_09535, partial [Candidatus Binatia bacterium]